MEKEKIAEVIERIKTVREAKGYSYQKIADMTEATGEPPVSVSAVKRIFSDEGVNCRWSTVRTVAIAVLGVGFDTPAPDVKDPDQPQKYYAEIEALKALVEAKIEMVASKDRSIEYLKNQLAKQEAETERRLAKRDKAINRYRLSTIILSLIIGGFFMIDYFNRNIGFLFLSDKSNILELIFQTLFV